MMGKARNISGILRYQMSGMGITWRFLLYHEDACLFCDVHDTLCGVLTRRAEGADRFHH
jgi:hypothetical protein